MRSSEIVKKGRREKETGGLRNNPHQTNHLSGQSLEKPIIWGFRCGGGETKGKGEDAFALRPGERSDYPE